MSDLIASLRPKFAALARHLPAAEEWASASEELSVRVEELSRSVADAVSRLEVGEEDLEALDARLTLVNRLKRKHRAADVAALIALRDALKARLECAEGRDGKIAELERERAEALKETLVCGRALSKCRAKAGERLSRSVSAALRGLGFLQSRFSVAVVPSEDSPTASGLDRVTFLFEPNPGESARPLAAVASSGEIARVMLAVKSVLAEHDPVGLMVFDEIDANIGGEVGRAVGEKMRAVAAHHQVIAITHLPQSAVYGGRHFVVSKGVSAGRTRTRIGVVEGEDRVSEIARMLGGEKLTSVTRKHAEELLRYGKEKD